MATFGRDEALKDPLSACVRAKRSRAGGAVWLYFCLVEFPSGRFFTAFESSRPA